MVVTTPSIRLRVDLQSKAPIIFSYPDLLKRHEKTMKELPMGPAPVNDEEDPFYKALLDRAAKYDANPGGEDVDSGEEDNQLNKDTKGDEYDYDDPFIDDSEMMLDDSYEYSQPEFDGFFVYHGALDGSDNASGTKKKAKKEKSSSTTGKAKASTSTSGRKTTTKTEAIEISEGEDDQPNKPTASTSSNTKAKKASLAQKSDTTKGTPTMKKSSSSTTTASAAADSKKASAKTNKGAAPASSASYKTAASGTSVTNSTASSSAKTAASSSNATTSDSTKKSSKPASNKLLPLHPTIEPLMEKVRVDRAKESFEIKSKFPPSLRPTVLEMATKMFRLYHEVDENVINHLMAILPYNRFTMKKFLTTKSGPGIVAEYQKEIDRLIKVLKASVDEAMPEHLQQYEQKLIEQQNQPTDGPVEKKFKCNETIRRTLYDILTLDMHSVSLSNEISELSNRPDMYESETKARKAMYARLLPCWPIGWMTTYDISRQYSTYKAKMKNTEETSVKLGLFSPSASTSSASATTTGPKRSAITPVKRSAPSTTSANSYNGTQGSGNAEKRKKMSINEASADNESYRQASQDSNTHDLETGPDDIGLQDAPATTDKTTSPLSPPSSHKPSSMNIASLISGP